MDLVEIVRLGLALIPAQVVRSQLLGPAREIAAVHGTVRVLLWRLLFLIDVVCPASALLN